MAEVDAAQDPELHCPGLHQPASTHSSTLHCSQHVLRGISYLRLVWFGFFLPLIEETVVAKKGRSSQSSHHSMLHAIYKKEKKVVFLSVSEAVPKTI